jgi:adenylate cyclase
MIALGPSKAVSGMSTEIERRLTNILSADVFGYSRLMGLDEAGTLAVLNEYKGVMTGVIAQHRGRVVSTAGDAVLAEFPSSVMAVQTAVDIQRQLAERNQKLEPDRQMWFRIGINLGDVIVERDDIFGDDVNIAARLQSMAEPGGILISGTVFDQVKNKLSLSFNFLGPQRLKNIDAEVPVYSATISGAVRPPSDIRVSQSAPPPSRQQKLILSAIRAAAIVAFLAAINLFSSLLVPVAIFGRVPDLHSPRDPYLSAGGGRGVVQTLSGCRPPNGFELRIVAAVESDRGRESSAPGIDAGASILCANYRRPLPRMVTEQYTIAWTNSLTAAIRLPMLKH